MNWQDMWPQSHAEELIFEELVHEAPDTQRETLALFLGYAPGAVARIMGRLHHARQGREVFREAIG